MTYFSSSSPSTRRPLPKQLELGFFPDKKTSTGLEVFTFFFALTSYLVRRFGLFLKRVIRTATSFWQLLLAAKVFTLRKLIWGRGRLGRPVAHAAVFGLSWGVFLVGGLLSGTTLVRSETYGSDVLSAETERDLVFGVNTPSDTLLGGEGRTEPIQYAVSEGDTLSSIGQKFKVTVDTLISANNISNSDYLKPGQQLVILPVSGIEYHVKAGDTLETVAAAFKVPTQAVVDINYIDEPYVLIVGQKLILPGASLPSVSRPSSVPSSSVASVPVYPVQSSTAYDFQPELGGQVVGDANFAWPTNKRYITQYFSYYHPAIDIAIESPIYAIDSGVIIGAGWRPGGFGNAVEIDHGNGFKSLYAHFSDIYVSVGDRVTKGQSIGMMGTTGRSTGVHLHLMISQNGQYIDPLSVL